MRSADRRAVVRAVVLLAALSPAEACAAAPDCESQRSHGAPTHEALLNDGWIETHDSDGVRVYNRKQANSPLYETIVRGRIAAPTDLVFSVVTDYAHYREFMPHTVESKVLGQKAGHVRVYERLSFPFLSDRHFVVDVDLRSCRGESGFIRVAWDQDNQASLPAGASGVVPSVNTGYWALWPTAQGRETDAIYYLHSDPGGRLPVFLVNAANGWALPDVLEKVRGRVADVTRK